MLSKNFLPLTFHTVSVLTLSAILLGSSLTSPTWAMEEEITRDTPHAQIRPSFFKYDLSHLEKAKIIIDQADCLPQEIRAQFNRYAETYDRRQFLQYADPDKKEEFLSAILSTHPLPVSQEILQSLSPELIEILEANYKSSFKKEQSPCYEIYFKNVELNILEKGPLNYALFDAFVYYLLGVGEKRSEEDSRKALLFQLAEIGFLRDFNKESLSNVEENYSPLMQLNFFHETNRAEVTDLVIAGGHRGRSGMESIGRYNNTLAIDLSPFQAPDIIADINDEKLLGALFTRYESHFNAIYETSNMNGLRRNSFIKPETIDILVRMLRSGGRLMYGSSVDEQNFIDNDVAQSLIEKYDLTPMYSSEYPDKIVALQKK